MKESIFRKKNIDRVNSPDQLNDYVKVVTPSIWLILIGVVVLLSGFIVWASLGAIDTVITTVVSSNGESLICYIGDDDINSIREDEDVMINGESYSIKSISSKPVRADSVDEYILYKSSLLNQMFIYEIELSGTLPDGLYEASIVVEKTSLISFLLD